MFSIPIDTFTKLMCHFFSDFSLAVLYENVLSSAGLELSDSDSDSESGGALYEKSWFSRSGPDLSREQRVEETRASLRRRLAHASRALRLTDLPPPSLATAIIDAARKFPSATATLLDPSLPAGPHLPVNK